VALRLASDRGYRGDWHATFVPSGSGTRVTVEERAEVPNPIMRIAAWLLFDPAAFSARYLEALAAHLEAKR
jgi:hypothetical protein